MLWFILHVISPGFILFCWGFFVVTWQNRKVQISSVGALEGCFFFFFAGTNLESREQYDWKQHTKASFQRVIMGVFSFTTMVLLASNRPGSSKLVVIQGCRNYPFSRINGIDPSPVY